MKVYFIRHGESVLTESRHQLADTPLSDLGIKQASAIAHRFTHIPIDIILTSSYTRALQIAQIIQKIKTVPIIQNDFLIERRMPSQFLGKFVNDPEIVPIHQTIREHFFDPLWHYADEENFSDLLSRVKTSLDFIHSQEKKNIVVVTHGYLLTVMIFYILFGDGIDPRSFKSFRDHTSHSNTGLTICDYKDEQWKLLSWNDCTHLEEK